MSYLNFSRRAALKLTPGRRLLLGTACLALAAVQTAPHASGQTAPAPKPTSVPAPSAEAEDRALDAAATEIENQLVPMGMDVQNILNSHEVGAFEKLFSRERFAFEVMQGIEYGDTLSPEMSKSLGEAANLGIMFYNWDPVSQFRFMRIRAFGDRLGLFMRCIHGNGSISYFTFFLGPSADGSGLRIVDVHNHRAAHLRSTIARHYLAFSLVQTGQLPQNKVNIEIPHSDLRIVGEMGNALTSGKLDAVQNMYKGLSDKAKNIPLILMMKMAASLENQDELLEIWKKMNEVAPKEVAQDLMLMDQYMVTQQWDAAIKAIETLDEKVGGDPYLTLRIARCHYEKGDHALAGKTAVEAIRKEPDLHAAYMLLLDLEVDKKNYEGAYKMLKLLADKFSLVIQPEEFDKSKDYEGFIASAEFKKWGEYAKSKTQQAAAPAATP